MKKAITLIALITLLAACSSAKPGSTKISATEAKDMMDSQEVVIVDVRTLEEYESGHIEGAILIPNEGITSAPSELPDKDAIILVYCRSGNRSAQASDKLVQLGYTNVYDFGGIIDWPYEIVQ